MITFIAVLVVLNFIFITINEFGRVSGMKALALRLGDLESFMRHWAKYIKMKSM